MRKRRRSWIYFLLAAPASLCLFGGVALFFGAQAIHKGVSRDRLEARKLGMPLTFADIPMPYVPDAENAAPIYRIAEHELDNPPPTGPPILNGVIRRSPPSRGPAIRMVTASPRLTSRVMEVLERTTGCDFHRDWSKGAKLGLPEPMAMRSLAGLFCVRASVEDRRGNETEVFRALGFAERVAKDMGQDPLLIPMLDQDSARTAIDNECEMLISRHTRDRRFLLGMDRFLSRQIETPDIRRIVSGELALGLIELHSLQTLRSPWNVKPTEAEKRFYQSPLVQDAFEDNFFQKWSIAWKLFPKDNRDWAGYSIAMSRMSKAIQDDYSPANVAADMLIPAFNFTFYIGVLQAHDRMLRTSVALLLSRLDDGKLPTALPSSLGEAGIDPFDGKPLRYRLKGSGFLIYSIGRDRTDDGGHRRARGDPFKGHFDEVMEFP